MDKIFNWLTDNKTKLMNKFILKMIPDVRDAEDFYQDLYLIMADKNLKKMTEIYERDEMEQYMYVIIRNNLQSKNICHIVMKGWGNDSYKYKTYICHIVSPKDTPQSS